MTTVSWQTWIDISESRGNELGLKEGDIVQVVSDQGSIKGIVYLNPAMPPNVLGVPLGGGRRNGSAYATEGNERDSSNVLSILRVKEVSETGALAWASNRVRVIFTGESINISKFEGEYGAREIGNHPGEDVYKTTSPGHGHS